MVKFHLGGGDLPDQIYPLNKLATPYQICCEPPPQIELFMNPYSPPNWIMSALPPN